MTNSIGRMTKTMTGKCLMRCGHVANAVTSDGRPCCAVCNDASARLVDRELVDDFDGLHGRRARCPYCGATVPSKWSLPFFKYEPTKAFDDYYCGCFGWD